MMRARVMQLSHPRQPATTASTAPVRERSEPSGVHGFACGFVTRSCYSRGTVLIMGRALTCCLCLAVGASCVESSSVICAGGYVCPAGTACDEARIQCVLPEQLTACVNGAQFTPCSYQGVTAGACFDGVCLPSGCGNGFGEPGEICDDGNNVAGDGCGAQCNSDETCGNGVTDAVRDEECDDANKLHHDGCTIECRAEVAVWRQWRASGGPGFRVQHAAAYDAARGELVTFGGYYVNTSPQRGTWVWNGSSWRDATPPAGSPSTRVGSQLAYDSARHRILLFGGSDPHSELVAWDGVRWRQIAGEASAPPYRFYHAMAYDAARDRLVVFGGRHDAAGGAMTVLGDTWEWDGTAWSNVMPATSPPARLHAAAAYDPKRGRIVLVGGESAAGVVLADTWEWDGTTWQQSSALPAPRKQAALAYDARRARTVLYGGTSGTDSGNTYERNGTTWSLASTTGPGVRTYPTLAYDIGRQRVVLFGGNTFPQVGDLWEWDGATWLQRTPAATEPGARYASAVAYDPIRGRIVMFGGATPTGLTAQTWEWDGTTWLDRAPAQAPSARWGARMAYDSARARVVLFGGNDGNYRDDTWEWNGTTWLPITVTGAKPAARNLHGMAYDPARGRTVLFGGNDDATLMRRPFFEDTWEWDGSTWQNVTPASGPLGRLSHALTYDPVLGRVVLFSGSSGPVQNDTWSWDGTSWQERTPAFDIGPPRMSHGMAFDGTLGNVVLFGGFDGVVRSSAWRWDRSIWRELIPESAVPAPRSEALVEYDAARGQLVAFGGWNTVDQLGDTWLLRYELDRHEACASGFDTDGDQLAGCDDPDCWGRCTPLCPPRTTCNANASRCGDGTCNAALETCRLCPADCAAACTVMCGDYRCDAGETAATCPGDCS